MAKGNRKENKVNQTRLYWPGKRTEVERVILPFQTVETINKSKADRDELTLFRQKGEPVPGWRNKLIWGDNKYIMANLLFEFAGKINLIYIDPPFATGADFSIKIKLGDLEWTKEASVIEEKAYRDTWGKGLDSYLQMMYDEKDGVQAFTKILPRHPLHIPYYNQEGYLRYYLPDFIVKEERAMYLVETKGMEGAEVPIKDKEALRWCENVERLTGESWKYMKVRPQDLETYRAQDFHTLATTTIQKS